MKLNQEKVLIIGSGLTAPLVTNWDLTGWTVVALHHGWQALPPNRWDVFLHCHDAPDDMKPIKTRENQLIVNTLHDYFYAKEYRDMYNNRNFRRQSGICRTMFFTGIWWVLHNLFPGRIGVIGCDMHYPGDDKNTFYGNGTCDPLLHGSERLQRWLGFVSGYCYSQGIELINFSPEGSPTILPFPHREFPGDTPTKKEVACV